ncbi:MAG: glycerate kinase [Nitrospirota bacterium]|nr:glycerate kinase [Nitrospirota bacterium]
MNIRIDFPNMKIQSIVRRLIQAGLEAADPTVAMDHAVKVQDGILRVGKRQFHLKKYQRVVCVGAGKAAATMAVTLERLLGPRLEGGVVVVKDGHGRRTQRIQVLEASHPVPDYRSERAAKSILELALSLTSRDLLIVLLSGGASSLMAVPARGLTFKDKQTTTTFLLRCGPSIHEINTVRKHLSAIKGGQLAMNTLATVVTLTLSDVLGDELATIGSGPTAPDPTTFSDAHTILKKYHVWRDIPASVRKHIEAGVKGKVSDTPKPGMGLFKRVHHEIIGNNRLAIESVAKQAKALGLETLILTTKLQGEAHEMGSMVAAVAGEIHESGQPVPRPACLLWGGELTVRVTGKEKGGRAQEFALAAALKIGGFPKTFVVGFGTDGTDGPTDVAGALVDGETVARALKQSRDPSQALVRHDSYNFFKKAGGHILTGPTGTNVNDIYMLLAM